jgi:hypothetical protein
MITVCGRKCLKTKHFRPQTVIMAHHTTAASRAKKLLSQ